MVHTPVDVTNSWSAERYVSGSQIRTSRTSAEHYWANCFVNSEFLARIGNDSDRITSRSIEYPVDNVAMDVR